MTGRLKGLSLDSTVGYDRLNGLLPVRSTRSHMLICM